MKKNFSKQSLIIASELELTFDPKILVCHLRFNGLSLVKLQMDVPLQLFLAHWPINQNFEVPICLLWPKRNKMLKFEIWLFLIHGLNRSFGHSVVRGTIPDKLVWRKFVAIVELELGPWGTSKWNFALVQWHCNGQNGSRNRWFWVSLKFCGMNLKWKERTFENNHCCFEFWE